MYTALMMQNRMQAELSESVISDSVHTSDNTDLHADVFDKTTKIEKIMKGKPYKGYKVMFFNFIMMIGLTCFVAKDMWDAHMEDFRRLNSAGLEILKTMPNKVYTREQYLADEEAKKPVKPVIPVTPVTPDTPVKPVVPDTKPTDDSKTNTTNPEPTPTTNTSSSTSGQTSNTTTPTTDSNKTADTTNTTTTTNTSSSTEPAKHDTNTTNGTSTSDPTKV